MDAPAGEGSMHASFAACPHRQLRKILETLSILPSIFNILYSVSIIARQSALPPVVCHHGGKSLRFDRLVALSHPKSGKSQTSTPQSSKVHPTHVFVSSFLFAADSYSGTRLLTQFAYYSSESRSVTISSMLTELHGRLNVEVA